MAGLIFLAIVAAWAWFALWLSRAVAKRFASSRWEKLVAAILFLLATPLPLIDEIIGGFQFRALCKEVAVLKFNVDEAELKGRTVHSVVNPSDAAVDGTLLPLLLSHFSYRDPSDGKELLSYSIISAMAGWLVRTLSGDTGAKPLTFGSASCNPLTQTDFGLKVIHQGK